MRKIKFVCLILLAAILLTGCAEQEKKEVYTIDEIYNESAYGFFVMNGDKFYPLKTIEAHDENVKWAVGEVKIPKVTKKTPVVAVFKNSSEMPNEYFIEKYNDLGYTLGANIGIGEDDVPAIRGLRGYRGASGDGRLLEVGRAGASAPQVRAA